MTLARRLAAIRRGTGRCSCGLLVLHPGMRAVIQDDRLHRADECVPADDLASYADWALRGEGA